MTKKDVLELKRRMKKNECTFTRMCGCYVDGSKEIVLNLGETFLNLEEEEFYKYLEIAKKTLSGTIGNNLLELNFPLEEEEPGGKQQFLMGLRESALKNDELLDTFYHLIIENYEYAGNYLILIFHDAYDVMTKTSDNNKLDESEEVYEYLICAICPVTLSKPGLGYLEEENRIGPRVRDWVVGVPENGFLFPAFTDRSTDIHSIMYYTKTPKDPRADFMQFGLGCEPKQTAVEQKETFKSMIQSTMSAIEQEEGHYFLEIQENLNNLVEEKEASEDNAEEPLLLTNHTMQSVLEESGIPEEFSSQIEQIYTEEFGDTPPVIEHLIDAKALAAHATRKREKELVMQVQTLQQKLAQQEQTENSRLSEDAVPEQTIPDLVQAMPEEYDVVLNVRPQKVEQITSQMLHGRKCLIIPLEENEHVTVNGIDTEQLDTIDKKESK